MGLMHQRLLGVLEDGEDVQNIMAVLGNCLMKNRKRVCKIMKTIYSINDINGVVKYVGCTNNFKRRRTNHINMAFRIQNTREGIRRSSSPIYAWMRSVGTKGFTFKEIVRVEDSVGIDTEVLISNIYRDTILNVCVGNIKPIGSKIYQYDLNMTLVAEYESCAMASKITGFHNGHISEASRGVKNKHQSSGGTHKHCGYYWFTERKREND